MNEYDRLKILGRGSHGVASLLRRRHRHASCTRDGTELCVAKEIDLSALPSDAQREAQNEITILRSLSHVNIVKYYNTFIEDDFLYILMEFADSGDLSTVIRGRKSEGCNFQELEVLSVLLQCGRALRHIHARRIVHRDFKSENVFLASNESDGCCTVKIGDFGTSKMLDHTRAMATTLIGTPSHLSPEVCDNTPYSSKADIWSLGVVFYELLTLEAPFQATNLAALVLKIVISEPKPVPIEYYSTEVRGFIKQMLEKDPARRPSAAQLLQEKVLRHVARLSSLPSLIGRSRPASLSEAETLTPRSLSEAGEAAPLAGQATECGQPGLPVVPPSGLDLSALRGARWTFKRRALGKRCGSQPASMVSSPMGDLRCRGDVRGMSLPEVLRSSPQRFANHLEKGVSEAEPSGTRMMSRPRPKITATQEEKYEVPHLPRLLGRLRGPEVVVGGKDKN